MCRSCRVSLDPAGQVPVPPGLDACVAALDYRSSRALLTAVKNGDRRDLLTLLADRVAARWHPPAEAVVTWAPTSGSRRRSRGFDQAELLARAVARRWGRSCVPLLRRSPGPAQDGRGADDRWRNPRFAARPRVPASVVVVDDVVTTGATLAAAARALRAGGAAVVVGAVAAHAAGRS